MDEAAINERRLAQFGSAVQLLFGTERKRFSIAAVHLWLWPAIRLSQIVATTGRGGVWTGYATWAYFSPEMSANFPKYDPPFLHISDWNEGYELWILDFVAPYGNARELANLLKRRLGGTHRQARHVVRDTTGKITGVRRLTLRQAGHHV